jgi:hypothetical protein
LLVSADAMIRGGERNVAAVRGLRMASRIVMQAA